mgnify:CR=1 FL=1
MPELEFTFDPERLDLAAIHGFLAGTYWSPGIPFDVVRRAVEGSLCIAAMAEGRLVAFARLVTDRATFAYLADVFVLPPFRGQGVSRQMLAQLFAHPDVQGLRRMIWILRQRRQGRRGRDEG